MIHFKYIATLLYNKIYQGGRIDHGHHAGTAVRSLTETLEMDVALESVLSKVDLKEMFIKCILCNNKKPKNKYANMK